MNKINPSPNRVQDYNLGGKYTILFDCVIETARRVATTSGETFKDEILKEEFYAERNLVPYIPPEQLAIITAKAMSKMDNDYMLYNLIGLF